LKTVKNLYVKTTYISIALSAPMLLCSDKH